MTREEFEKLTFLECDITISKYVKKTYPHAEDWDFTNEYIYVYFKNVIDPISINITNEILELL